jgi:hypothetical protein
MRQILRSEPGFASFTKVFIQLITFSVRRLSAIDWSICAKMTHSIGSDAQRSNPMLRPGRMLVIAA